MQPDEQRPSIMRRLSIIAPVRKGNPRHIITTYLSQTVEEEMEVVEMVEEMGVVEMEEEMGVVEKGEDMGVEERVEEMEVVGRGK